MVCVPSQSCRTDTVRSLQSARPSRDVSVSMASMVSRQTSQRLDTGLRRDALCLHEVALLWLQDGTVLILLRSLHAGQRRGLYGGLPRAGARAPRAAGKGSCRWVRCGRGARHLLWRLKVCELCLQCLPTSRGTQGSSLHVPLSLSVVDSPSLPSLPSRNACTICIHAATASTHALRERGCMWCTASTAMGSYDTSPATWSSQKEAWTC